MSRLDVIRSRIAPARARLLAHPLYARMASLDDVRVFMRSHVFAVWDFMSLLKSLQRNLTFVEVPWFPVGSPETRFLINEIVVGEESDRDPEGNVLSHYELYRKAMEMAGAHGKSADAFLQELKQTAHLGSAFEAGHCEPEVRDFVRFTFDRIRENKVHVLAALFTFGREDLIPGMFMAMVREMDQTYPEKIGLFRYYLERHIEVDGDHHSHLALQMTAELCGNDPNRWEEALQFSLQSLRMRKRLWDGVYRKIKEARKKESLVG